MRILLIEPDRLLATTYQSSLEKGGFEVNLVAAAQAAIMAADKFTPDIVILELQLIEHSGIEFLYEFRSYPEWQDIPVIVHTQVPPGEFSDSWQLLKNQLGVEVYLYKPYTSIANLLKQVNALIKVKA